MKLRTLRFDLALYLQVPDDITDEQMAEIVKTARLAISDAIFEQHKKSSIAGPTAKVDEVILRHVQVDKR